MQLKPKLQTLPDPDWLMSQLIFFPFRLSIALTSESFLRNFTTSNKFTRQSPSILSLQYQSFNSTIRDPFRLIDRPPD